MALQRKASKATVAKAQPKRVLKSTAKGKEGKSSQSGRSAVLRKPSAKELPLLSAAKRGQIAEVISINRAPVLTLWMTVCLKRLGWQEATALSAAQVVTGRCANAKGRSLGIIKSSKAESSASSSKGKAASAATTEQAEISGHKIPLMRTPDGLLKAVDKAGSPIEPRKIQAYLVRSFQGPEPLAGVAAVMEAAASSHGKAALRTTAFELYERFRPAWKGWGQKGELHMGDIRAVRA
eukprot:CAMPEP_0178422918 /NCGR_PEP_ID=MMETSP0689_2-20121128/27423_1 /TAXON_ID=160604 /ORGANISM="Amphidinium massartii, Strain CS-259" /LENGTH=236 /DNA_ID=CAMNT_0020044501 /DNA_START=37 /DNA_END=747 /DNA_ORIENTATION=+